MHCHNATTWVSPSLALTNAEGIAPYNIAGLPRQINMTQMKEQIKAPKIELSDKEIANLSDTEF